MFICSNVPTQSDAGYVNRNWPDTDPGREGGGAIPSFEFFPSRGAPVDMQLMIDTSGLNMYVHAYLMPSGAMFVQSYLKTSKFTCLQSTHHHKLTPRQSCGTIP